MKVLGTNTHTYVYVERSDAQIYNDWLRFLADAKNLPGQRKTIIAHPVLRCSICKADTPQHKPLSWPLESAPTSLVTEVPACKACKRSIQSKTIAQLNSAEKQALIRLGWNDAMIQALEA